MYWGDKSEYWLRQAEQAPNRSEQERERAKHAGDYVSKKRTLNLAKRYDQIANLAENRVKKHVSNFTP